jgi:type III secretion system YscD/HrpQ family protein
VPTQSAQARAREFRVASGVHQGAVFALADGDMLVIGTDEACDICLTDSGIAPRHATLISQGATVSVRRLDGAVLVDGVALTGAARETVPAGAQIVLGESGVTLELTSTAETPPATNGSDVSSRARRRRTHVVIVAMLGMMTFAGVGVTVQELYSSRAEPVQKPDVPGVREALRKLRLNEKVAVTTTANGVVLTGVIDLKSASLLQGALAPLKTPVVNSIVSEEELLDQVREVFRTHGYRAEVSYSGGQVVLISNLDETHGRVQQAAARARSDIPQLRDLSFGEPGSLPPPPNPPAYQSDSRDRLSARVDGETAYLAASGGTRYFAGSVLPGGHTVRRITPQGVQLERDGEIAWFRF